MTLQQVYNTFIDEYSMKIPFIGIYEEDENKKPKPIYSDYADELLETHGDLQVNDYYYSNKNNTLVVEFKKC